MENRSTEFRRATLISFLIFLVLLLLRFLNGGLIAADKNLLANFLYCMLYGYSLYYANSFVFARLDLFFNRERFTRKRLFIGSLISFAVTLFVIFLLRVFEDVIVEKQSFETFLAHEKPANYIVSIVITLIITLTVHAFYFYKAYQENKVREQKIIAGTASAQFESLKNQIDPHFLFNSLNVLSSLIEENPESAQRFTTSLSKVYRYVLEQKDKELVSVSEELAFAKTYMNLLKMRFENSISFEMPQGFDNPDAKVVPLSLQLLLENTIKHNSASELKPLQIRIFIEDNFLVVRNELQKKEVLADRKGVGLQNIADRYAILTQRKVLIEQTPESFSVKIPILTKQIMIMDTVTYDENTAYYRAKKRVGEIRGFYGNLISYICIVPFLVLINLQTVSGFHWFWFPMLGWGMGLAFHALNVFGYGASWEERQIKKLMKDENKKENWQ